MMRPTARYTILCSILVLFVLFKLDNFTGHLQHHSSSGNNINVHQETAIEKYTPSSAATTSRLRRRSLQVFNRLRNYLDPKSITLRDQHTSTPQQNQQHSIKVSYVTSFWAKVPGEQVKVNPHRREVEAALLTNIHNPHLDQIVVFLDTTPPQPQQQENDAIISKEESSSCNQFHHDMMDLSRQVFQMSIEEANEILTTKLTCVNVLTGQPTYYQMFTHALSEVVTGDVVLLANADMVFDTTISFARGLHPEVLVVLGTSGFSNEMPVNIKNIYEQVVGTDYATKYNIEQLNEWGINRCMDRESKWSWDTWIFHKQKLMGGKLNEAHFKRRIQNNDLVPFHMNENGAENASLWAIQQAYPFTSIYNACERIHSWHFHMTPKTHTAREIGWWNVDPESVPRPWGGYTYPEGNRAGYPPKDPECVRTDSCFI